MSREGLYNFIESFVKPQFPSLNYNPQSNPNFSNFQLWNRLMRNYRIGHYKKPLRRNLFLNFHNDNDGNYNDDDVDEEEFEKRVAWYVNKSLKAMKPVENNSPKDRGDFEIMTPATYNLLLRTLFEHVENLFDMLAYKLPHCSTYKNLIDAYFKKDRVEDALNVLDKMFDANFRVLLPSVFEELIIRGKAEECQKMITKWGEKKDQRPHRWIYDAVIRRLCNAGALDEALILIHEMIKYHRWLTPSMREPVCQAFQKLGRHQEINKYFLTN
ncbi:hypothetical protein ACFE04_029493 [Oxalis oulophora]